MSTQPQIQRLNQRAMHEALADELGINHAQAKRLLTGVFNVIARSVIGGNSIMITNFGTFHARTVPEHTSRNPQTGEPVTVPEARRMRLRVSDRLAELVAAGDPTATIAKLPKGGALEDRP